MSVVYRMEHATWAEAHEYAYYLRTWRKRCKARYTVTQRNRILVIGGRDATIGHNRLLALWEALPHGVPLSDLICATTGHTPKP